jgi:predicted house-cleaning noncanonical NTP pyrophosphatase (MazG superfamily)
VSDYALKLVRDREGEAFKHEHALAFTNDGRPCNGDHVARLRQKLLEEVGEYLIDPSVDELADVLQVVQDLSRVDLDSTFRDVEDARAAKFKRKGGFGDGRVMVARELTAEERAG